MIPRKLKEKIVNALDRFPVVGILGSRQVGKTTLAKEIKTNIDRPSVYLDLELPSDVNKLQEPELYLGQFTGTGTLVIIDEIQRIPGLFPLLRALVDQDRKPGRFLILGSASRDLIKQSSESLAGRIVYHELTPFTVDEVGKSREIINKLWLHGGYPDSFSAGNNEISFEWRQAFIGTYLERDIPQLGIRIPAPLLRRFWTMVAHCHGQLWNASMIAKSLEVTAPTVKHYLNILEETFLLRRLQPYCTNIKKRLVKSPKIYIRDTGLLHALLMNRTLDELQGHPHVGNSWEGFAIEQVMGFLPPGWEAYFYRTGAGAEIDMVIISAQQKPIAVEIKYSSTPNLSKGFWNAFEDLGCEIGYVIYPGNESYPLGRGVSTLPVGEIDRIIRV
jgi:predicted AAA+ superfamily ATPase